MAKDFRPMASDPAYKRGEFGILMALGEAWKGLPRESTLEGALRPFLEFTWRHSSSRVPWGHRLYILFTGRLPQDF